MHIILKRFENCTPVKSDSKLTEFYVYVIYIFTAFVLFYEMLADFFLKCCINKWATTWQNQQNGCASSEDRSAWASAQSDQSLGCPHEETLGP